MGDGVTKPPKYAHFESVEPIYLADIYMRHAEVAREIHQDVLRKFTGNNTLTVDLVRVSPITADEKTLDLMAGYDVMSVSSVITNRGTVDRLGASDISNAKLYKERFAEDDMPIYVVSAGNEGRTGQQELPRIADFARTSLVVGEANFNNGQPYIEGHSSRINPTISADNPFNHGKSYQMFDPSPSLVGHEELIRGWLVDKELNRRLESLRSEGSDGEIEQSLVDKVIGDLKDESYADSVEVNAQIKHYMDNPWELHTQVFSRIMESENVDANGYISDENGTSFSSPELAGHVSGAHYEQTQRELENKPILAKEEISTLAKMATIDITTNISLAETYNNRANIVFSDAGGHGVFRPDMFRSLLDETYKKMEKDPNINRDAVTVVMHSESATKIGNNFQTLKLNTDDDQEIMIDRTRLDFDFSVHGGDFPTSVAVGPSWLPLDAEQIEVGAGGNIFAGWVREDTHFGEVLSTDEEWDLLLMEGENTMIRDAALTVYGYNKGGLMDQMVQFSKTIEADYSPKSDALEKVGTITQPLDFIAPVIKN